MCSFSVNYNSIDESDILNIHKCFMTKNNIKYCLVFIALLSFRISIARKCVSLNDEPSMIRLLLI